MGNKLYQDEFEQFLQDEVKQHRMYPSDHIWKNIRTQLHGYSAWPALTFISLFIITALTLSTLLNNHPDHHLLSPDNIPAKQATAAGGKTASIASEDIEKTIHYFQHIAPEEITAETFAELKEYNPSQEEIVTTTAILPDNAGMPIRSAGLNTRNISLEKVAGLELLPGNILPETTTGNSFITALDPSVYKDQNAVSPITGIESAEAAKKSVTQTYTTRNNDDSHSSADRFFKDFNFVSNTPPRNKNSRFGFQLYITPSSSYRTLSDKKVKDIVQPAVAAASSSQNVPLSLNNSVSVNDVVRQKPGTGIEAGFALLYNMTTRLKFKTGIQFNLREYYIETFQSLTDDLASLSLINYRGVETINFYSPYNNNTGYKNTQLDNKVYQIAVPLGLQYEVLQGKHLGFSAEASVQPTFTVHTSTYLLSTDYKHYTPGNDLIRKWNINTSMGFNITYKTGSTEFAIGPQIRYQHLPSYSNLYPIKEYLVDYGVRFGITKQIK